MAHWRFALVVVGALASFTTTALAQDAAAALNGRLDAATTAAVTSIIDSAAAAGLPTRPLLDKALEGASKGAPNARIIAAVRSLAHELADARTILGPNAAESDLVAAAGALTVGVGRADLTRLHDARQTSLALPLVVMADLVARGVPASSAADAVTNLARARAPDDAYAALRRGVEQDIAHGTPAAAATEARARAMLGALPPPKLPPAQTDANDAKPPSP